MPTKRAVYPVELKASGDAGQVEALVSIFDNVDLQGDRVMPGAFRKSISEWKQSGDPVPVVFSHDWGDMWSHIGVVDTLEETAKGLRAVYTLDITDNPAAAQTFKLLKRRSIKEHSFAYDVVHERRAKDGANELTELKIIEVGPTLKGANPDTELLAVKSMVDDGPAKDQLDAAIVTKDLNTIAGSTGTVVLGAPFGISRTGTSAATFTGTLVVPDAKAGRRLSQATQAEMQAISDDLHALRERMSALMGTAEDEPKDDDGKSVGPEPEGPEPEGAEPGDTGEQVDPETEDDDDREPLPAKSLDEDLLRYRTRIEEMCATPRSTK